jgi:8-oxo-dGTP pyrophosphatase MutT (NUDIX family)
MEKIRAKAVCLFRRDDKILLAESLNPNREAPENSTPFIIPVGGGIEFGEHSKDAAIRETLEEISAVALNVRLLGIRENIFTYDGRLHHEIVFVYEGDLEDESLYELEVVPGIEDSGVPFTCRWFDVEWLREGHVSFFPEGIIDML